MAKKVFSVGGRACRDGRRIGNDMRKGGDARNLVVCCETGNA